MSAAARSVLVFGIYMLGQGAILMLAPGLLLEPFDIAGSDEPWVRVVGWALVALAIYYLVAARNEWRAMFQVTVLVRIAQFVFFVALCASTSASWWLVGFSAIELLAGVWTAVALRADAHGG